MINYRNIYLAEQYYDDKNYMKVDVPWIVSKDAIEITKKVDSPFLFRDNKCLVGSAEQSFLQLYFDKKLTFGKYQATTPCFRDDNIDHFHQQYFMKTELIYLNPLNPEKELDLTIKNCHNFFNYLLDYEHRHSGNLKIVQTNEGFDIELNGIEIGSYGIRKYEDLTWVYATGIAEPRFTKALNYELDN